MRFWLCCVYMCDYSTELDSIGWLKIKLQDEIYNNVVLAMGNNNP